MKKILFLTLVLCLLSFQLVYSESGWQGDWAADIKADVTDFDNNLSSADDTVQKALETLDELSTSSVSDTAYAGSWDGVTTIAPSKNAVFDKIEGLAGGHDAVTVADTTTINMTLTGQEVKADGLYTAGDHLTLTAADFDVDDDFLLNSGDTSTGALIINNNDGVDDEVMLTIGDSNDLDNLVVWGEIAIGTAVSSFPLHIIGVDGTVTTIMIQSDAGDDASLRYRNGTNSKWAIGNDATDDSYIISTGTDLSLPKIHILQAGEVGIKNGATSSGLFAIYEDSDDGTNNATFIVPALTADTDYTLPPDDGDAGEQLQTNGSGVLTWEAAGAGSATALDDVADPDAATSITLSDTETVTLVSEQNTAGSVFKIDNTVADVTNNVYLLDLEYTDDGQANADFFKCSDNNGDVKFSIQEGGNTAIAGTLGVTGQITGNVTGNLTGNADTVTTNANLTGEVTSVGNAATIADSISVTSWNLTTPTITTSLTTSTPTTLSAAELDRLDGLTSVIIDDDKIDTFAELDAIVADKALVNKADGAVWLGVHDFGGATSLEIPNTAGDVTCDAAGEIAVDSTQKQLVVHDGTAEVAIPLRNMLAGPLNLAAIYDLDTDYILLELDTSVFPDGIVITGWELDCFVADPVTEINANLMYCDDNTTGAFPGANATLVDVLDTTTGNSSCADMSGSDLGSGTIPAGKILYLDLDADPTDDDTFYQIKIKFYIPES